MRRSGVFFTVLCVLTTPAFAQDALQPQYEAAYYAWDEGDYPAALEGFKQVLNAAGGERFLEDIALVTGELYHVEEIAPDGHDVRWSPDGKYAAYETGTANRVTHIVTWDKNRPKRVAEVEGHGLAFSPAGDRAAYLTITETPGLKAARATLDSLRRVRDFDEFRRQRPVVSALEQRQTKIWERHLTTGQTREIVLPEMGVDGVVYRADGAALIVRAVPPDDPDRRDLYVVESGRTPAAITDAPGWKSLPLVVPGGRYLVYATGPGAFVLHDLKSGGTGAFEGNSYAVSADGSTMAYLHEDRDGNTVNVMDLNSAVPPRVVQRTANGLAGPALSPDGAKVIYQMRPREDWDLYVVNRDGSNGMRLTYDIQNDLFPRFMTDDLVLAVIGEGRHRRSFVYEVETGRRIRLFHNNTIRTVAPEYEWAVHPSGTKVLIVSERDGDTISPERAVYVVDLSRKRTKEDILRRIDAQLAAEIDLRERGRETFEPIADAVREAVAEARVGRIYAYARDLYSFGSKYITEPGNHKAIEYITNRLKSWGYQVKHQWFEPRPGVESANIIATLPGTAHPDLVYVVSSHFDSVQRGPGADDNASGSTALLEAARVMAGRPMPATIQFAWFTGEEAGLLGSREFVRRAVADGVRLMGALNNDMVGWANNHRLDDTIRYSNAGIRDIQHAAAFLFTDLITYDAKYYKSTDAHAYYDAYGDIVGGIGSYPILSSPHYHQTHDVLEIINQRLVTEVSKTTIASIMLLASSPARLKGLEIVRRQGDQVEIAWTPAPETDVTAYIVAYGQEPGGLKRMTVTEPKASLSGVKDGMTVAVKAVNDRGMGSWDWARVTVGRK